MSPVPRGLRAGRPCSRGSGNGESFVAGVYDFLAVRHVRLEATGVRHVAPGLSWHVGAEGPGVAVRMHPDRPGEGVDVLHPVGLGLPVSLDTAGAGRTQMDDA